MMFARAVADPNPAYYDEAAAKAEGLGNVPAPPTFVQASAQFDPDYFLRPKVGQQWFGSGRNATGITKKPSGRRRLGRLEARGAAPVPPCCMPSSTTRTTSHSWPARC